MSETNKSKGKTVIIIGGSEMINPKIIEALKESNQNITIGVNCPDHMTIGEISKSIHIDTGKGLKALIESKEIEFEPRLKTPMYNPEDFDNRKGRRLKQKKQKGKR